VDAVSEVYHIEMSGLRPAPEFGGAISGDFVKGLAMIENKMVIVLEIDNLITLGILEQPGVDAAQGH
jgi:purine-binding chemotaxis protein CheW